ncbi:MAG: UDP-N-acetylmuramate:L-alanyl-gamma-D-glutamyl-meso-diaminopimelate ligase [Succinivibrio dextrinosolvens]|nr:UDP-N-acetylmuramate:L-alanyl-gamma-D-glutamyl-meso-diaminopimelate ligase [Succinivibrio dextrinosolvens]
MHIHILGICGTFMGGIAMIAKQSGFKVTGSDLNVYPPMSDELKAAGIELIEGFDESQLDMKPDLVVVGNVMRRGMPIVEKLLNERIPFVSGPQWLEEHYLLNKKVLAVAGTHGKTTTSSMLAWILEANGRNPGFLIGGIPENFGISARNSDSEYFVIEADEYDCAFFDKRSKFVHYHPSCLIMNNLEYDHADIFDSVKDIQKQFHHLIRTIPSQGLIVMPNNDKNLNEVIQMGCWSNKYVIGDNSALHAKLLKADGSEFEIYDGDKLVSTVKYDCTGAYNVNNSLMAIKAASYAGISTEDAATALQSFKLPKRRMELKGVVDGVEVYDDFAHHPTAIRLTLEGLRAKIGDSRKLIAVFEPRSNSMKLGANHEQLAKSFESADEIFVYANDSVKWNVKELEKQSEKTLLVYSDFEKMLNDIVAHSHTDSTILVMSNGGFNGIHQKLLDKLHNK